MFKSKLARAVATCCGLGYAPYAPGTCASVVAFISFWLVGISSLPLLGQMCISLALFMVGVWASERESARLGESDPQVIVIDEWCAVWLVCSLLPHRLTLQIAGLILFRFFDITKPGVIKRLERLHGGLGIMMDDLAAGVITVVVLTVLQGVVLSLS